MGQTDTSIPARAGIPTSTLAEGLEMPHFLIQVFKFHLFCDILSLNSFFFLSLRWQVISDGKEQTSQCGVTREVMGKEN